MLRNPALLTLWGGEFASRIGTTVFQIALLWYLLEATGDDSLKTGMIAMVGYLPAVLLGLWAGVFVDRLEYRAVMLGANLVRAALAATIPLLILFAGLPLAGIALMGFLLTSATAFFNPARDAVIPKLAEKDELVSANSLVQSAWQFSLVIGPLLAATALSFARVEMLFHGVALSFALSFLVLLFLRKARQGGKNGEPNPAPDSRPKAASGALFSEFREGLSYLRSERRVFWIWILTALNNFFLMGAVIVGTPIYVKTYLGGTATDFALVEGTYAGGMIVFTWLIARYGERFNPLRVLFLAMIYDGLSYLPLYWVTTVEGTLLTILVHSLGIPAITISRLTALHRIVPQHMRGRVFSYINLAVDGMTALAIGVVGIVLVWMPANVLFAVIGVLAASTGVLGLMLPVFREE